MALNSRGVKLQRTCRIGHGRAGAGIDIVARASAGPSNFGLPTLVDGLAGKGTDPAEVDTAIRAPRPLESAAQ